MLVFGASFVGLLLLPVDFSYWAFALLILINGDRRRACSPRPTPPRSWAASPPAQRGAASGMRSTFQNTGTALSIGVFFSLMIAGLASNLPPHAHQRARAAGRRRRRRPPGRRRCRRCRRCSPPSSASTRSRTCWPPTHALATLPPANRHVLTGTSFFPQLISGPFHDGLVVVFIVAAGLSVLAALASLLRGGRYVPTPASIPRPKEATL